MATAPLSLYAETPEEQANVKAYKDAQQALLESLEGRKQLFDPTLLAISQALGTPTRTGSFGEVLGNVAGAVGTAQQGEEKRAQELAKMRMELAQANLQQAQATRGEREFRGLVGRMGGQPAVPTGAPVAGDAFMPSREPTAMAAQATEGARSVTPQDIARLAAVAPEKAKILQDMVKMDQDRFAISMNGIVFDRAKGQYLNLEIPGQTQADFATPYGTFKMTPNEYAQFTQAERQGAGKEWIENFRSPGGAQAGVPGGRKTVLESDVERKGAETTAEKRAVGEAARYEDFVNKGASAGPRISQYSTLEKLVSSPNAKQYLGVFENPDLSSALFKLLETSGKGLPQINEIRDIFINLGLDKNVKADQLFAQQLIALANLELRKITRTPGEGPQSDLETRMAVASGLDRDNTPEGMRKKLQFLRAKAEFDRDSAKAIQASKMNANQFLMSDDYQRLLDQYERKLSGIVGFSMPQKRQFKVVGREPSGG